MKKKHLGIILSLLIMGTFVGCFSNDDKSEIKDNEEISSVEESNKDIMEVDERIFITEVSYIKNHPDEYLGKKIKLQGYYYLDRENEEVINCVVRNAENYSGQNGIVGFEFTYDGELPKENDWIEVVGVLEECDSGHLEEESNTNDEDGHNYVHVRLKLESIKVMDTRGQDTVNV